MADTEDEGENEDEQEEQPEIYLGEYEGERNDKLARHGYGEALLPNGDRYKGGYQNSKRHGHGVYLFRNGIRYEGDWTEGVKHGPGKFLYPDGSSYEGYFVKDNKHGYGVYKFENGDMYAGEWKTGQRHGYGVYRYKDSGAKYCGFWENDERHGKGEILCGPYKYVGDFALDQPAGPGKFAFLGGAEQHGHFTTVMMDPAQAAMTTDTPAEEQAGVEMEEGASIPVLRWTAEKLVYAATQDPSVDPEGHENFKSNYLVCFPRSTPQKLAGIDTNPQNVDVPQEWLEAAALEEKNDEWEGDPKDKPLSLPEDLVVPS